jgi:hypothetical protein
MLDIPYDQLTDIIREGDVPVISIDETSDGSLETGQQLRLTVKRRSQRQAYTAISHVWAHGLGNPDLNALPYCQVRQIKQYLEDLKPKSRLWKWKNSSGATVVSHRRPDSAAC